MPALLRSWAARSGGMGASARGQEARPGESAAEATLPCSVLALQVRPKRVRGHRRPDIQANDSQREGQVHCCC